MLCGIFIWSFANKLNNRLCLLNSRKDGEKIPGRRIKRASLLLRDAGRNSGISGATIAPYERKFW